MGCACSAAIKNAAAAVHHVVFTRAHLSRDLNGRTWPRTPVAVSKTFTPRPEKPRSPAGGGGT